MCSCIKIFTPHRCISRVGQDKPLRLDASLNWVLAPKTLGFGAGGLSVCLIRKCAERVRIPSSEVIFQPDETWEPTGWCGGVW